MSDSLAGPLAALIAIFVVVSAYVVGFGLPIWIDRHRVGKGRKPIVGRTLPLAQADSTELSVTTSYVPLSLFQALYPPVIEVDGVAYRARWGANHLVIEPGRHDIKAYHRWFFYSEAYASCTTVDVPPGGRIELGWQTGWYVLSPGVWTSSA